MWSSLGVVAMRRVPNIHSECYKASALGFTAGQVHTLCASLQESNTPSSRWLSFFICPISLSSLTLQDQCGFTHPVNIPSSHLIHSKPSTGSITVSSSSSWVPIYFTSRWYTRGLALPSHSSALILVKSKIYFRSSSDSLSELLTPDVSLPMLPTCS